MREPSFPKLFPQAFIQAAYCQHNEAAWKRADALNVLQWCADNALAVAGVELWVVYDEGVQCGVLTGRGLIAYEHDADPEPDEAWPDFCARSIGEVRAAIEAFQWPADAQGPEREPYFYLVMLDELWMQQYLHEPKHPG